MADVHLNDYHFVISAPRSGSTWLARALNGHPEILATENRLFGMFCEIWKNPNGKSAPRITTDQYFRGFANHSFLEPLQYENPGDMQSDLVRQFIEFLTGFLRQRSRKRMIVDKITPYLGTSEQVLRQISKFLPGSKIIHLIRDGRDVATSGVFDWIAREDIDSNRYRLFVKGDTSIRLTRFFDDELLERWARYWSEPSFALIHQNREMHRVAYEDMIADQGRVLDSILKFLGVQSDPELSNECAQNVTFEKTTGRSSGTDDPLAKQRKGIVGDWKNYFTRADAEMFQALTGDLLQSFGYEVDPAWVEGCPVSLDLKAG